MTLKIPEFCNLLIFIIVYFTNSSAASSRNLGKQMLQSKFYNINYPVYSQTCVQQPPLGPEKSGGLKEVPDKIEVKTGC
jgi:hypothetical protein